MYPKYLPEAICSMKASRWTILLARVFGRKTVGNDGPFTVTLHTWRGKSYVTGFTES